MILKLIDDTIGLFLKESYIRHKITPKLLKLTYGQHKPISKRKNNDNA